MFRKSWHQVSFVRKCRVEKEGGIELESEGNEIDLVERERARQRRLLW